MRSKSAHNHSVPHRLQVANYVNIPRPPTEAASKMLEIGLTSPVRLAQPILNREVRRAVVPCFKGRIRRGVSRLVSAAAEIKPQLRSALHGRPVITPVSVAG